MAPKRRGAQTTAIPTTPAPQIPIPAIPIPPEPPAPIQHQSTFKFVSTIEPLCVENAAADLDSWVERFEIYCEVNCVEENKRVIYFLSSIGKDAYMTIRSLCYPRSPKEVDFGTLIKLLRDHYLPSNFVAMARARFHSMVRRSGQSIKQFVIALQEQAALCEFKDALEDQLRDRFIAGIADYSIQRRLLTTSDMDFAKAKLIAITMSDAVTVTEPSPSSMCLMAEKKYNFKGSSTQGQSQGHSKNKGSSTIRQGHDKDIHQGHGIKACDSCGGLHRRSLCKFLKSKCYSCGKVGHIAKVCKSQRAVAKFVQPDYAKPTQSEYYAFTVDMGEHLTKKCFFKMVRHMSLFWTLVVRLTSCLNRLVYLEITNWKKHQ